MADHDEVDDLVAAWQHERPDVNVWPMHVLSRVTRLSLHLDSERRNAFAQYGLVPWEFDVLSALRRSGEPYRLSPGQLVSQTLVTSGTMTNRVDRLVVRGLVQRQPHPADRRGVLVALTESGRHAVDGALEALLEHETELLSHLAPEQARQLADTLRTLTLRFGIGG